jgi:uncharacterized membrane-anchored protein
MALPQRLLLLLGAALVFGGFNGAVLQKEALLRDGRVLRLALAPVDPRAFMTGDYMALDYVIAAQIRAQMADAGDARPRDAYAVVAPDPKGIGRLVRVQERATPLADHELALKVRQRRAGIRIGTDAYYFREGTARNFAAARYGELRVADSGDALLVGLLDNGLATLPAD